MCDLVCPDSLYQILEISAISRYSAITRTKIIVFFILLLLLYVSRMISISCDLPLPSNSPNQLLASITANNISTKVFGRLNPFLKHSQAINRSCFINLSFTYTKSWTSQDHARKSVAIIRSTHYFRLSLLFNICNDFHARWKSALNIYRLWLSGLKNRSIFRSGWITNFLVDLFSSYGVGLSFLFHECKSGSTLHYLYMWLTIRYLSMISRRQLLLL